MLSPRRGAPKLTPVPPALYIGSMAKGPTREELERQLRYLESRVDELVRTCERLREENRSLQDKQEDLVTEKAGLLQHNEQVRSKVEAMISRLKSLEHSGG